MALKELLINNNNARKIFGKKEIEIILKQMNGVSLTQSEKNRLSRDIRPKFDFIKESAQFADEFKMKKNSLNNEIIKKAVNAILDDKLKKEVDAIFLFGSHADKTATKESDIDICVLFKGEIPISDATKFRIRILGELNDKVDLQVFNILPQKLKRSIARNHKLIYRRESFDNLSFSIRYLKDDDYFLRMEKLGVSA